MAAPIVTRMSGRDIFLIRRRRAHNRCINRRSSCRKSDTTTEDAEHKLECILLHPNLYALAFLQGNVASMKQQADWVIGKPSAEDWMLSLKSDTEAWSGRLFSAVSRCGPPKRCRGSGACATKSQGAGGADLCVDGRCGMSPASAR
jgi:hypothetical protein